jgi:hypothetical protein
MGVAMNHAEARRLGYDLLREHGLLDWDLSISDLTSPWGARLQGTGFCDHALKLIMLDEVEVARGQAENVFLHEIAHALLPADETPDHSHRWASKALEIGVSEQNVKAHCPTYFERGDR